MMNLKDAASYALEQLHEAGADDAAVIVTSGKIDELNIDGGEFSLMRSGFKSGLSLKAIKEQKTGNIHTNSCEKEAIDAAVKDCMAAVMAAQPDEAESIAPKAENMSFTAGALTPDRDKLFDRLQEYMDTLHTEYPKINMEQLIAKYDHDDILLMNTNGVEMRYQNGGYIISTMFSAHEGEKAGSFNGTGNNSTFTTRVVTSSGSDTYSTVAAALSSVKGPRHGGANIKVIEMIQDIKGHLNDWTDPDETRAYLKKILAKETFDHSGLIYGMGHAVYSISDPREQILRSFVNELAIEKGRQDDLALYRNIEVEAPKLISKNRPIYKGVSANIDLYSGFLYDLLGIPMELYTPLFAIARIVGWSAHRIEELVCMNKIIRPAYMSVMRERG